MNLHLAEIAAAVAPCAHAALILDQAGWHLSDQLVLPPNITLVPLPPKCPELNPIENVWQFMRDNWLSNRIWISHHRRLARDDERHVRYAAAFVRLAMIRIMLRRQARYSA